MDDLKREGPEALDLCCGGKRCPTIRLDLSGEKPVVEIFEEGVASFKLDSDQVSKLQDWLRRAGF